MVPDASHTGECRTIQSIPHRNRGMVRPVQEDIPVIAKRASHDGVRPVVDGGHLNDGLGIDGLRVVPRPLPKWTLRPRVLTWRWDKPFDGDFCPGRNWKPRDRSSDHLDWLSFEPPCQIEF